MSKFSSLAMALVALALMLTVTSRAHADDTATGISGTVVDAGGTGVKGAVVKLFAGPAPAHGKKAAPAFTIGNSAVQLAKGEKKGEKAALAEFTTVDDKGSFSFSSKDVKDLVAGEYHVTAEADDASGAKLHGHENVTVTSGAVATVTVTLKAGHKKAA